MAFPVALLAILVWPAAGPDLFSTVDAADAADLDNTAGLRRAKREVARALTVARERELQVAYESEEN